MNQQTSPDTTPISHVIFVWSLVGIPLIWGVMETILNAMKLFG
jgi:hypothetical protein